MSPRTANLLLLLAGAVWGMGFIAQETAMEDMGPFLFTALRFLLAGLVVLPLAIREQLAADTPFSLGDLKIYIPLGSVFFLALVLQQIGLITTTVTNAGFLTALYVILVPLLLLGVWREKQSRAIWPAAMLALGGIYLLSGGELSALVSGDWLVILGALFGAIHVIFVGRLGKANGKPFTLASMQFLVCGGLGLGSYFAAPLIGMGEGAFSWDAVIATLPEILYAGIFSGALAFSLMAIAQQYADTSAAAILLSTESLFAALFAALLLGERLASIAYLGCGLIFAALLLIELMPAESGKKQEANT